MKRIIGVIVTATAGIVLGALLLNVGGPPVVDAAGTGPNISLGTVTLKKVTVTANTVAANAFKGFNIHVRTAASVGVVQGSILGNATDSIVADPIDAGTDPNGTSLFCSSATPIVGERVFACSALSTSAVANGVTLTGLLATFTFNGTGNGCIDVQLVDLARTDANVATLGTYTINVTNVQSQKVQSNVVDTSTVKHVFIGTGTIADCPGFAAATATPTSTQSPTPAATDTPTSTPTATPCSAYGCPTASPTLTPSAPLVGTLTPTGTPATATATSTVTPVPPAATAPAGTTAPPPGGGTAGRTGIRLPDTGTGGSGRGTPAWWLAAAALAAVLGAGAAAVGAHKRRS